MGQVVLRNIKFIVATESLVWQMRPGIKRPWQNRSPVQFTQHAY